MKLSIIVSILLSLFLTIQRCCGKGKKISYKKGKKKHGFNRISNFFICEQIDASCDTDSKTNVRAVTSSQDGRTLIYANPEKNEIGFVDVTDPHYPKARGTLPMPNAQKWDGTTKSIAALQKRWVVVAVDRSKDYTSTGGFLVVVDIPTQKILKQFELGGQPNAVEDIKFVQALPTGNEPEGLHAIPNRNLFIVANEKDKRSREFRSSISIYSYVLEDKYTYQHYPQLVSKRDRRTGLPKITWSSLSGLTQGNGSKKLYAVHDNSLSRSRFYEIDIEKKQGHPHKLQRATTIWDAKGVLAQVPTDSEFTIEDLNAMLNDDNTVNLDGSAIAFDGNKYVYIVSKSKGRRGGTGSNELKRTNMIIKVHIDSGVIEQVITLPSYIDSKEEKFTITGIDIIKTQQLLVVAFERELNGDDYPLILRYNLETNEWLSKEWEYCLDDRESPNGGFVIISDITVVEDQETCNIFVLETDNQGGPDARVKRVYHFPCNDGPPICEEKKIAINLTPILDEVTQGAIPVQVSGMAHIKGKFYFINDNGGSTSGIFGPTYLFPVNYKMKSAKLDDIEE